MPRSLRAWGLLAVLPALVLLVFALPSHVADASLFTDPLAFGIDLALIVGIVLGVLSAVRERAALAVASAWILLLPVFPLGLGYAWIPVLASVALLVVLARQLDGFSGATRWAARALAALVALAGVWGAVGAMASGIPEYLALSLAVLALPALMLWAAWWPRQGGSRSATVGP